MSIGCGPCTELAAIDYMREKEKLKYSELEFYGIDISGDVWNLIWNDIKQIYGDNVRIFKENVFKFVDEILEKDWVPDLIILQYVFSDMRKKFNDEEIIDLLKDQYVSMLLYEVKKGNVKEEILVQLAKKNKEGKE